MSDLYASQRVLQSLSQKDLEEGLVDLVIQWAIRTGQHPAKVIGGIIDLIPWDEEQWQEQLAEFRSDLEG